MCWPKIIEARDFFGIGMMVDSFRWWGTQPVQKSPEVVGRAWWKPHLTEWNSFRAPFLWAYQDPIGRCTEPVSTKEAGSWQLITAGLWALPSWCSTPAMHPLHFRMLVFAPRCLYSRHLAILAFLLNPFSSSLTLSLSPSTNAFFFRTNHIFMSVVIICMQGYLLDGSDVVHTRYKKSVHQSMRYNHHQNPQWTSPSWVGSKHPLSVSVASLFQTLTVFVTGTSLWVLTCTLTITQ